MRKRAQQPSADPLHCEVPRLRGADIAAVYSGDRIAGDFYEFLRVGPSRVLFVLLDMAGTRSNTREILSEVQHSFRGNVQRLFSGSDFNETLAMSELCYEMNRTVMRRGVRSCPAFIGSYNEELGTLCYANAGHPPGLLRDWSEITLLGATGLPLGLFSHTTQSAATCHLVKGAAVLVVSRGIVEADCRGTEFGIEGAQSSFLQASLDSAYELSSAVVEAAHKHMPPRAVRNDLTALSLVRLLHEV